MQCILTALKAESDPLIASFDLSRSSLFDFPVFVNSTQEIYLIGLGVGKSKVEYRINKFIDKINEPLMQFINIGVAGSNQSFSEIGDIFLINKITDEQFGHFYYPDILIDHSMIESDIVTVMDMVNDKDNIYNSLVDMEASEIFRVCSPMIPIHNIAFIKIVSDHMEIDLANFNGTLISSFITDKLDSIIVFLDRFKHLLKIAQPILSQMDIDWVHKSKEQLLLTETQTKQLKDKARFYRLRNGSHSLPIIKYDKPSSKLERKRLFKDICEVLTK